MNFFDWLRSLFKPKPNPPPIPPIDPGPGTGTPTGKVVMHVNQLRQSRGLPPVAVHQDLTRAAAKHSADMAVHNSLSHRGSDGSMPKGRILDEGYEPSASGECVAQGQATAEQVVNDWATDPPHREILLGSYRHIGVGRSGTYWTADFASPV